MGTKGKAKREKQRQMQRDLIAKGEARKAKREKMVAKVHEA